MKPYLVLLIFGISLTCTAQTLNSPESVVFDILNNRYLISNAGTGMSGGSIVALDRGSLTNSSFISYGINSPKGMIILAYHLFFTDVTYIRKADLNTGAIVASYPIAGAIFCNDILHHNGYLYISDTEAHRIYKFELTTKMLAGTIDSDVIQSPNGLAFDTLNNRIVFVSFRDNSPVQGINPDNDSVFLISPTPLSKLDGVAFDKKGNIYISSWETNKIYISNGNYSAPFREFSGDFSGPADFIIATNDTLLVPNFNTNTLSYFKIKKDIKNKAPDQKFTLSPNPFIDFINITNNDEQTKVTLIIYSRWGNELRKTKDIQLLKGDSVRIELTGFNAGQYPYVIKSDDIILQTGDIVKH